MGVYFDHPPQLLRRQWILSQLRRCKHDTVIELGCGDGPITRQLVRPTPWLDPPTAWKDQLRRMIGKEDHPFLELPSIAPRQIVAIDVDKVQMSRLAEGLAEQLKNEQQPPTGPNQTETCQRFQEVTVHLQARPFQEVHLDTLLSEPADMLIASEVIEHLDKDTLAAFPAKVFGQWVPSIVLITTPNYDFNKKFRNDEEDGGFPGYLDPTGRTDRIFRHDDHHFEWTKSEFQQWAEEQASQYGYTVTLEGVGVGNMSGKAAYQLDLAEDEDGRFLTSCAIFTRLSIKSDAAKANLATDPGAALVVQEQTRVVTFGNSHVLGELPDEDQVRIALDEAARQLYGINGVKQDLCAVTAWSAFPSLRNACHGRLDVLIPFGVDRAKANHFPLLRDGQVYIRRQQVAGATNEEEN